MGIGEINLSKVLVLGNTGQVGKALLALPTASHWTGLSRLDADFTHPETLPALLDRLRPGVVINAAAYTQVDRAESEPELAEAINSKAPGVIARWCAQNGVPFVHYSTDYVFPGTGTRSWEERDSVSPLNIYGKTKLQGEAEIQNSGANYLIFRTSWVYDSSGKNFLTTMLRLGRERKILQVVNDQIGAPTYAGDLADWTWQALQTVAAAQTFPSGVYHLCPTGETSWHGFASAIFDGARARSISLQVESVLPISTEQFPTPAKRPRNSRLSTTKFQETFGVTPSSWQSGLKKVFDQLQPEKRNS